MADMRKVYREGNKARERESRNRERVERGSDKGQSNKRVRGI